MQVMYFLPLLLLSPVSCLSVQYYAFGHFLPRFEQRVNDKGFLDYATERVDVQEGVDADSVSRQYVTTDKSEGEGNKESENGFGDGKVLQEMSARINVKPQATFSETYGGFTNLSESNIITQSPHLIAARSTGQCVFPTNFKEAEIDCTTFPNKVICTQTCMFGYTMEGRDGIKRRMECNMEENVWKPVPEFEKCKPFVDCGLTIGPGGSYTCRRNYMHKGPDCDIACSVYEDKEHVPTARYECDITGKWTPQLPFCATGGSPKIKGVQLVPAPSGPKLLSELEPEGRLKKVLHH